MSFTSKYTFLEGFFNGLVLCMTKPDNVEKPFSPPSTSGNVLTVPRPSGEILLDLAPKLATPANLLLLVERLKSVQAVLKGGLRVQGVRWPDVKYFIQNPGAHKIDDMLIRLNFDFVRGMPGLISDIEGTISIYLFLFIDGQHHLRGQVDGSWFEFVGGWPFDKLIAANIKAALPSVVKEAKLILEQALAKEAGTAKFGHLYIMPGNGSHSPSVIQNASDDAALGLLLL